MQPGPDRDLMLWDLASYCYAKDTTHVPGDPFGSAVREGRRQVWNRLRRFSEMDDHEIEEAFRRGQRDATGGMDAS